jgi:antitoxin YefM
MQAVTLKYAQQHLERVIANVIDDEEPVFICQDAGRQIVCMPLALFHSWQETAYLLRSPANAEHLRNSIAESHS